jgi:tRNA uridine 5-carbamoylmethylation protein Kti12
LIEARRMVLLLCGGTTKSYYVLLDSHSERSRPVVVDDTNCFRFLRDDYRAVAERHGARTTVVYVDAPLALIRDRRRENDGTRARASVTEPVLLDLVDKFEVPGAEENVLVFPAGAAPETWVARYF